LGETYQINPSTAYRRCLKELEQLPHLADVTREYCSKFCGILVIDGKYIKVKGYERKIPVLYGIDYLTHDIPTYIFSRSESYQTCRAFFSSLRLLNYPLQAVISDDNVNIYDACVSVYPKALTQLCHNHYKENLRISLGVRTDGIYLPFMQAVEDLFSHKRAENEFLALAAKLPVIVVLDKLLISAFSTPASAAERAFCELACSVEVLRLVIVRETTESPTVKATTIIRTTINSVWPFCPDTSLYRLS
jgi:hypothetical protein